MTQRRLTSCRITLTLAGLAIALSPIRAQVQEDPPTNLQIFQRLALEVGVDLRTQMGGPPPRSVQVFPREIGLPLEQDLLRGLNRGAEASGGDTVASLELAIFEAQVFAQNLRRDGFLGPSLVDRVVRLAGTAKGEGRYVEFSRESRDTVLVSGLERLVSPALPFTKMSPPSRGFFDNVLEPLVVLGSVGVAIYLLFAVRS